MRFTIFITSLVVLISCSNQDKVTIPLHANSYDWIMGNDIRYFVNSVGDSVKTDSVYFSNTFELVSEDGFNYEYGFYYEIVTLDSVLSVTNTLKAGLLDNMRSDALTVKGIDIRTSESTNTFGIAENANTLDSSTTNYHDTLVLNQTIYTDLYSTKTNNKLTLFVSPLFSLVGFALENDTFNLVN